ncbi:hypothetical protein B0H41_005139 [Clostridium beijerinckii]|uniref:Uncharacterized protein n=1 Tax=Clostridium beijerinckii TaxID=1520 RepID=A0AAX0B7X2_CLOBE|nr:hypothetical protein [Clostridium beijerinckii]NRT91460.1 hypothetical protein [Clostridium beijerinckii]
MMKKSFQLNIDEENRMYRYPALKLNLCGNLPKS